MEIKRFTTQYDSHEDRVRLVCTDEQGQTLILWLTQRLLNRLVSHLCSGLVREQSRPTVASRSPARSSVQSVRTHVEQSFAQQKAKAALSAQPPVVPRADAAHWRVDAADVKQGPSGVHLILKGALDDQRVKLHLSQALLRQWLGIVYEQ
jgi:hypothetical protein